MSYYVRCPYCRSLLDASLNPSGRVDPKDWEPTVCSFCGNIAVFEHGIDGGLRPPTRDDWDAWDRDLVVKIAQLMHLIRTTTGGHR